MISRRFPVFLAPSPDFDLQQLRDSQIVRIRWDDQSWYLYSRDNVKLFSFDLPTELFSLYQTEGLLTERRALDLKEDMMSEIQLILNEIVETDHRNTEVVNLILDHDWIEQIRIRMG